MSSPPAPAPPPPPGAGVSAPLAPTTLSEFDPAAAVVVPIILTGTSVRLEPLTPDHAPALLAAVSEWRETYAYSAAPDSTLRAVERYIEDGLAEAQGGTALPFAVVRQSDGKVVGSTRFLRIEHWEWESGHPFQKPPGVPDVAEIGNTWLAHSAQRTAVNTEAKYLMLCYAFEVWQVHRVALRTDARNKRSRAAIERIGAKEDGMIRADRPSTDGQVRDSVVYSILAAEWPEVKAHIEGLLRRYG